jgi:predicted Zn-dependent protease
VEQVLETREAQALYEMALEKMRRNIIDGATADLQRALQMEPENPVYLSYYGVCLAHRHRIDEAIATCKRALRDQPRNTELRVNLGKVYRLGGDTTRAHRTFLQAWQADRGHPGPATELARMGVRRPPVLTFLPRSHWCNRELGRLRWRLERALAPRPI